MIRLLPIANRVGTLREHYGYIWEQLFDSYGNTNRLDYRIVNNTLVIQARGKGLDSVRRAFTEEGFTVIDSSDDETVLENLAMTPSNTVFLVDDSPKGSRLCTMIRCFSNIPILALCHQNKVKMLEKGADACVSWPVSPLEMIARVRSLQRRYQEMYPPEDDSDAQDSNKIHD